MQFLLLIPLCPKQTCYSQYSDFLGLQSFYTHADLLHFVMCSIFSVIGLSITSKFENIFESCFQQHTHTYMHISANLKQI